MASSSGVSKVCFNSCCNQSLEPVSSRGWLCRTGDFAELCARCGSDFEDGKFCAINHSNDTGWRRCETCGKQIHCGCIVSFHMFVLLDAGGIECLKCAKSEYILTPNPAWPSAPRLPAETVSDIGLKSYGSIGGLGPVPWRQASTLFNGNRCQPGSWRVGGKESIGNKSSAVGIKYDSLPATFVPPAQKIETGKVSGIQVKRLSAPMFVQHAKKSETGNASGIHVTSLCTPPLKGSSLEKPANDTKAQGDKWSCSQNDSSYRHQCTNQDPQQLSGGSHAKITPLFEKVLTPSDVGKIGRLVIPKKYAEAHLPPISQPEGCPLAIQDFKGKDRVLQYRYWPNNNSRMYVLEGVTPCIQSMQLQAGDTVTFSRLEPEGKFVMGYRKASLAYPSDKANKTTTARISAPEETIKDGHPAKRRKGDKMCSNSKKFKLKEDEILQFSVTLEQAQELLRPPLTNAPTIVLIEGVEFEAFQEAPTIGSPKAVSTDNVGSHCSTEVKPKPEHLENMLPTISHENQESVGCMQPSYGTKHKSTPMVHHDLTHPKQVGNTLQNPTRSMYADIISYTQMGNGNENHKAGPDKRFENGPSREKSSDSTFKNFYIDLNIQPEREEESCHVSDSMGIMRLVEESTQRYIKQQKLSMNDVTDRDHKNHGL